MKGIKGLIKNLSTTIKRQSVAVIFSFTLIIHIFVLRVYMRALTSFSINILETKAAV